MSKTDCPNFDACNAPICPIDENSVQNGIWYLAEEICNRRSSQKMDWIRKQKAIVKARAPNDRYFTLRMLQAIRQVRKGIEGINPDQPLEQAKEAERRWIEEKKGGRVIAKQNQKPQQVIAGKKDNSVSTGETSHQAKGGEN